VTAVVLDSGEFACGHQRSSLAGSPSPTRAIRTSSIASAARRRQRHEVDVEVRPLARYDRLIPA
jgi:hypothetical protein